MGADKAGGTRDKDGEAGAGARKGTGPNPLLPSRSGVRRGTSLRAGRRRREEEEEEDEREKEEGEFGEAEAVETGPLRLEFSGVEDDRLGLRHFPATLSLSLSQNGKAWHFCRRNFTTLYMYVYVYVYIDIDILPCLNCASISTL